MNTNNEILYTISDEIRTNVCSSVCIAAEKNICSPVFKQIVHTVLFTIMDALAES